MDKVLNKDVENIMIGDKFILYPDRYLEKRVYYATAKEIYTNHIVFEIRSKDPGFFDTSKPYNISLRKLSIGIDEVLAYA